MVRVRVTNVRTEAGDLVTLRFAPDRVQVQRTVPARQRAARACAGGLIAAAGLAAVAANAGNSGLDVVRLVFWIAAAVVVLVGVVGGGVWWLLLATRGRADRTSAILASSVLGAQSTTADGAITVSLTLAAEARLTPDAEARLTPDAAPAGMLADAPTRTFTAAGHAGSVLSTEFGRLLDPAPADR